MICEMPLKLWDFEVKVMSEEDLASACSLSLTGDLSLLSSLHLTSF